MTTDQQQEPRTSYVYAIGDAEKRHVKIGYSTNMPNRLASLQTGCHFEVRILWTREGDLALESALHERFADYRRRGEWFEFPPGQDAVELISHAAEELVPTGAMEPSERHRLRSCITRADADVAKILRIPPGSPVLEVERVIYKDGEPVELTVTWARPRRVVASGPMKECQMRVLKETLIDEVDPARSIDVDMEPWT